MKFKCQQCGKEYSYGRKIYHKCNGVAHYHGRIFEDEHYEYPWNYLDLDQEDEP